MTAHEPAQFTGKDVLGRVLTCAVAFTQLVESHPADGGIETRSRPPQPQQLEHGLHIGLTGRGGHTSAHLVDQQAHRSRVAGEEVAQRLA